MLFRLLCVCHINTITNNKKNLNKKKLISFSFQFNNFAQSFPFKVKPRLQINSISIQRKPYEFLEIFFLYLCMVSKYNTITFSLVTRIWDIRMYIIRQPTVYVCIVYKYGLSKYTLTFHYIRIRFILLISVSTTNSAWV